MLFLASSVRCKGYTLIRIIHHLLKALQKIGDNVRENFISKLQYFSGEWGALSARSGSAPLPSPMILFETFQ